MGSGSQGCNTIALYTDIIPKADRQAVLENIVADIRAHDTHITTGNMCSRYIIELLLENGYEDLAFELLTRTTYPSWGYMIENGATTIWERWEQIVEEGPQSIMASYNHPMYGAVGVCFYKYLAGIRPDTKGPGFERFTVAPVIPEGLRRVEARVETCRGELVSGWAKEEDGALRMNITVPYGAAAKVRVPVKHCENASVTLDGQLVEGFELELSSGSHVIRRAARN